MKSRAERQSLAQSSGFTLFEVVVALAIAAAGLGLLMSAAGEGLGNSGLAYQYVEATRRAQSHLAEIGVTAPLLPGLRSGDDGGGFTWSTRISAPSMHMVAETPGGKPLGLYTVEVSISWRSGNSSRTVSLRSQRLGEP
jgi:general secretion pathway protein I